MSTSNQEELESPEGEELVAYLDGELSPEESRQVEERLASDVDYREQLRELDQVWEKLDELPRTSVDDDFARTTIEMVAIAAQRDLSQRTAESSHANRSRRLRWAAVAVVAATAGFAAASILLPNKDQQLIKDLPVIRQYDLLSQITDIGFLRELSKSVPLEQLTRDTAGRDQEVEAIRNAGVANLEERLQWVENLVPDEKQDLWAQEDRFAACTDEEKDRLRNLASEIATDPEADQLQKTLVAYGGWLATKPDNDRHQLRKKDVSTAERLAMIQQFVREEGRRLSDAERLKLKTAIRAIADENKEAFIKSYAQAGGDEEKLRKSFDQQLVALDLYTVAWALNNEETAAKTRKRLIDQLDPQTREFMATLEASRRGGGPQRDQLWRWSASSVQPSSVQLRRTHNPTELMRFFAQDLSNEERKQLSDRPPAEFETHLAQMYDTVMMMDPALRADLEERTGVRPFGGRPRRGEGPPRGGRGRRGGPPGADDSPQIGPDGEPGERGERGPGERGERNRGRNRDERNNDSQNDGRRDDERRERRTNESQRRSTGGETPAQGDK